MWVVNDDDMLTLSLARLGRVRVTAFLFARPRAPHPPHPTDTTVRSPLGAPHATRLLLHRRPRLQSPRDCQYLLVTGEEERSTPRTRVNRAILWLQRLQWLQWLQPSPRPTAPPRLYPTNAAVVSNDGIRGAAEAGVVPQEGQDKAAA